ncbi:MAG: hypothetical protein J6Y71_08535 [Ruminococcus sp.]|nr:hypothetical protein [Ruminococcus sp.]
MNLSGSNVNIVSVLLEKQGREKDKKNSEKYFGTTPFFINLFRILLTEAPKGLKSENGKIIEKE